MLFTCRKMDIDKKPFCSVTTTQPSQTMTYLHKKFKKIATISDVDVSCSKSVGPVSGGSTSVCVPAERTPTTTTLTPASGCPNSPATILGTKVVAAPSIASRPCPNVSGSSPNVSGSSPPSPEFLHRHITKLINDNQVIVETKEPVLSRRYQKAKENCIGAGSNPRKRTHSDTMFSYTSASETKLESYSSPHEARVPVQPCEQLSAHRTEPHKKFFNGSQNPVEFSRPTVLFTSVRASGTFIPKSKRLGLTNVPVMPLDSPETPRPKKSYGQLYLCGNAYTYLGMKCSTRMTFCTLNKSQPTYVLLSPEHSKVSMYSNWKVRSDADPYMPGVPVSKALGCYDSRQRQSAYTVVGGKIKDTVTHSSYWLKVSKQESRSFLKMSDLDVSRNSEKTPKFGFGCSEKSVIINGGVRLPANYRPSNGVTKQGHTRYSCEKCQVHYRKHSALMKHIKTQHAVSFVRRNSDSASDKPQFTDQGNVKERYDRNERLSFSMSENDMEEECNVMMGNETDNSIEADDEAEDDIEEKESERDEMYSGGHSEKCQLEREAARSLLSLSQMTRWSVSEHFVNAGLVSLSTRPRTYPYSFLVTTECTVSSSTSGTIDLSTTSAQKDYKKPVTSDQSKKKGGSEKYCYTSSAQTTKDQHVGSTKLHPSAGMVEDDRSKCMVCNKVFSKPSQLRLHVNIHYFEQPFRCEPCAVSFRTKGHLHKHLGSNSHLNKINMNSADIGVSSANNPRPFKCDDCSVGFRIHGHLAKHLRSKMHIMKLECLGKLPFGTYAEMERCGINMNDIDTTDCENSLESLQRIAKGVVGSAHSGDDTVDDNRLRINCSPSY